jgi:hypothetical protein
MTRGEIGADEPHVRWIREHGTLHIPDLYAQNDFPMLGAIEGRGEKRFLVKKYFELCELRITIVQNLRGPRKYSGREFLPPSRKGAKVMGERTKTLMNDLHPQSPNFAPFASLREILRVSVAALPHWVSVVNHLPRQTRQSL